MTRQAPAVRVRCPGGGPWLVFESTLAAAAAATCAGWLALLAGAGIWTAGAIAASAAALGALAMARSLATDDVTLAWDGARWTLRSTVAGSDDIELGAVELMLDAGGLLLLRLRAPVLPGGERWLAIGARAAAAEFRALCVAVYAARHPDDSQARPAVQAPDS